MGCFAVGGLISELHYFRLIYYTMNTQWMKETFLIIHSLNHDQVDASVERPVESDSYERSRQRCDAELSGAHLIFACTSHDCFLLLFQIPHSCIIAIHSESHKRRGSCRHEPLATII